MRVAARGKSFVLGGSPFRFRAVTTGSWADDLAAIAAAGYTVVSCPSTAPPPSLLESATAGELRFVLELDDDVTAFRAASRRERRRLARELVTRARRAVKAWEGDEALLGVVLGVARQSCTRAHAGTMLRTAEEVAVALHDEDPRLLAGWRGAWPQELECPPEFDFLIFDAELTNRTELGAALVSCHRHVGDRPLVLGRASIRDGVSSARATAAWLAEAALRNGAAGHFEPYLAPGEPPATVEAQPSRLRDLSTSWPSISVVVAAHNAGSTLNECLHHCERLDYPELEVIVVDDGSTDATAAIAAAHGGARLVSVGHRGLAAARNVGYKSARGELIAFLDADAYPSAEWPWYLALAAMNDGVGGSGGPNVPPPSDPASARIVARSPGGPVPQLLGAERAAHLPGCNMAFWKHLLERLGGFDPVFDAAADDLEFQQRVLDSGYELGYHPAALVWHHRRPGLRSYLRQQRHYGRSHATFEHRYPERFPAGYRLRNAVHRLRSDGGETGATPFTVSYLTLPRQEGTRLELAHQWGLPPAGVLLLTAPLALARRKLAAPALAASAYYALLFAVDIARAGEGRRRADRTLSIRAQAAAFRILRPLAFRWGHLTGWWMLRRGVDGWPARPAAQPEDRRPADPSDELLPEPEPEPLERASSAEHSRDRLEQDG